MKILQDTARKLRTLIIFGGHKKFLPNAENCMTAETIYNYNEQNSGAENRQADIFQIHNKNCRGSQKYL